jgi:MFS family permease
MVRCWAGQEIYVVETTPTRRGAEDAGAATAVPGALAPFRSRIFLALWIASQASNFGSLIQNVGAAWLMTALAGSADMVALVQVATVLPIMLFSLVAGAAADVWDRRRVMLCAQGGLLVVSAVLAGLAWSNHLDPWSLVGLTFLVGVGGALYGPAWQASVREQVPRAELPAAVALNSVAFNLARAAGPALGGVLVAWAGAQAAFAVNAVSYLGLIAVLATWQRPVARSELPPETFAGAMLSGLRFARLSHALQAVLVRAGVFGFLAAGLWALVPLIARDLLGGGAVTYGALLAAFGAGAVAGAFAGTTVRQRFTGEGVVAGGSLVFSAASLVVATSPFLPLTLLALVLGGAAWLLVLSTFNVTVQLRSPRWVVGRAMAIYQAGAFGGLALGAWLWGFVATRYGVPIGLGAPALLLAVTSLLGRVLPMPLTDVVDLEPATNEIDVRGSRLDPESGPIVTSTEYRIPAENLSAFLTASRRLQRMRGRNGARRFALLQDTSDAELWTERFELPTWLDYLRLQARMTVTDRAVDAEIVALHAGEEPPVTRHRLAHVPGAASARPPDADTLAVSQFDPALP